MQRYLLSAALLLLSIVSSCGRQGSADPVSYAPDNSARDGALGANTLAFPDDALQPWEQLDSHGFVVPESRGISAFPADSEFIPGIERFSEGGDVTDSDETTRLDVSPGGFSYAVYRVPMAGEQPGSLSVDCNPREIASGGPSDYWLGLADFAIDAWQWHGPYSEAQVTLLLEAGGGDYSSSLGNAFVAIAIYDEGFVDIVGVAVSPLDNGDTTPPATPGIPTLERVAGGLEASWPSIVAADLAGYRIYYSFSPFDEIGDTGVRSLDLLEGTTRTLIRLPERLTYVGLTAVDVNGNESELSTVASGAPLPGNVLPLTLHIAGHSRLLNDAANVMALGADSYDFDVDGDGDYDISGDTTGEFAVDTSKPGIIRPRVRASNDEGSVAFGSISLIVTGNQRPVANAEANPSIGTAPHQVDFNGSGVDFDGTIAEYAWDFDGDGTYDHNSPADAITAHSYTEPGLYNAKLRVTDDQGAWDVDTVAVQVIGGVPLSVTNNNPQLGETITFTAHPPRAVSNYEWDLDGNGSFETNTGSAASAQSSYLIAGPLVIAVRVTWASGGLAAGTIPLTVHGWYRPSPQPDEGPGNPGTYQSAAIINERPAVAYHDPTGMKYVTAADPEGSSWFPALTIGPVGSGTTLSLGSVNGRPAISYYDSVGTQLMFQRAVDVAGTDWSAPAIIADGTGGAGAYSSMRIVNGYPAIAFQNSAVGDLVYVRATDIDGNAWAPSQILDAPGTTGFYPSMQIVNGNPAIAYYDSTNGDLRYIRATDQDGTAWNAPQTVDATGNRGLHPSMAILAGHPVIAYADATNARVLVRRATSPDGTTWGFTHVIASTGAIYDITLLPINGVPHLSFVMQAGSDYPLWHASGVDLLGESWNPATVADGRAYFFESTMVDTGAPGIFYGRVDDSFTDIDIAFTRLY